MSDTYLILEASSIRVLAQLVNRFMTKEGYDVQGGICAVSNQSALDVRCSNIQYSQAMVKKDA